MPAALLSCLLLFLLRGQEECRKQAGIGHWGRSAQKYTLSKPTNSNNEIRTNIPIQTITVS